VCRSCRSESAQQLSFRDILEVMLGLAIPAAAIDHQPIDFEFLLTFAYDAKNPINFREIVGCAARW